MDIYHQKSKWKIWLAIVGICIIAASFFYTNHLTSKLEIEERNRVEEFMDAYRDLNVDIPNIDEVDFESDAWQQELNKDYSLAGKIVSRNKTIPIIIESDAGIITTAINFPEEQLADTSYLRKEINKLKRAGSEPVIVSYGAGEEILWYFESLNLRLLRYFPFVQFALISAFIGLGYIGFSNSRRSEQNQVWAGMAKETAHQLGTPISAIIGWIEHLKSMHETDPDSMEVLGEFRKDVSRLELIADRFSKIGSEPELERRNIYEVLDKVFVYMQRRSPRKVQLDIPTSDTPLYVNINEHLFEWVIENLIRNAIDSSGGEGRISGTVSSNNKEVTILISDTGKGIPANKFKTVFQPGYTTKKRGWGLGLSLAKRIIESYHLGRIFVKASVIDEGTTFAVKLPES